MTPFRKWVSSNLPKKTNNPNPSPTGKTRFGLYWFGAGNRTRTGTLFTARDFKLLSPLGILWNLAYFDGIKHPIIRTFQEWILQKYCNNQKKQTKFTDFAILMICTCLCPQKWLGRDVRRDAGRDVRPAPATPSSRLVISACILNDKFF